MASRAQDRSVQFSSWHTNAFLAGLAQAACAGVNSVSGAGPDDPAPKTLEPAALYDTGSTSADPLGGEVLTRKTGWVKREKAGSLKGDAVLATAGLAVAARSRGPGLEIYGGSIRGDKWRGERKALK